MANYLIGIYTLYGRNVARKYFYCGPEIFFHSFTKVFDVNDYNSLK